MAGLSAVRTGIQTVIVAAIPTLNMYDVWPDTPNSPGLIVRPMTGDQHTTFASRGSFFFELVVFAQIGTIESSQDRIDTFLDFSGSLSIQAALEAAPTLNGSAEGLMVGAWRDYNSIEINGLEFMRAVIPVEAFIVY